MASDIHYEGGIYPHRYEIPEHDVKPIGTVAVKNVIKQKRGERGTDSVMVLFESAMTNERYIPKKIIGREIHVYPDLEQVPLPLGDTRAATAFFRGRKFRRWNRRHIVPRARREDATVYPFYSIGRRTEKSDKEKEREMVAKLNEEKQLPMDLKNKRFVPELDRLPIGFDPGYNEPRRVRMLNPNPAKNDPSILKFNTSAHQFDPRTVKVPYVRSVRLRWRGRLLPRQSGQRFWPTRPAKFSPRDGHGPYNWGPIKDKYAGVDEFEGLKMCEREMAQDDYYAKQPSKRPKDVPVLFDFLPDLLQDEIADYEWYEGPVEDGMEGYFYSSDLLEQSGEFEKREIDTDAGDLNDYYDKVLNAVRDEEYHKLLQQRDKSHLEPTKVETDAGEFNKYYTELRTPQGTPKMSQRKPRDVPRRDVKQRDDDDDKSWTQVELPAGSDKSVDEVNAEQPRVTDQAWVPLPGRKMMDELDVKQQNVTINDRIETAFRSEMRYSYDVLPEERK